MNRRFFNFNQKIFEYGAAVRESIGSLNFMPEVSGSIPGLLDIFSCYT